MSTVSDDHSDLRGTDRGAGRRLSRPDLVLLAIPALFVVAIAVESVAPIPRTAALTVGGVAGATVMLDALFFNSPDPGHKA